MANIMAIVVACIVALFGISILDSFADDKAAEYRADNQTTKALIVENLSIFLLLGILIFVAGVFYVRRGRSGGGGGIDF